MMAVTPILDPEAWVAAFLEIPRAYKAVAVGLLGLYITFRYWPWRRKKE